MTGTVTRDEVFSHHAADFEPPGDDEDVLRFAAGGDLDAWLDVHFSRRELEDRRKTPGGSTFRR